MKYKYYGSFIPGLQNLISDVIKERLSDVIIHKLLDGAVLFETKTSYDKLNFFCFNNIFAVIEVKEEEGLARRRGGAEDAGELKNFILSAINKSYDNNVIKQNNKKIKTFRMVFSLENTPVAVNEKLRFDIEKYIEKLSGLKVNRQNPDTEFWFLLRNEKEQNSFSVFMKRLTLRPSWDNSLHKGELPPPLAWSLCRLANPEHSDTALDPFCGYGAIPEAALKYFHIKKIIACDNDKAAASFIKKRFKNKNDKFIFYQKDFANLHLLIGEKRADVIITDPPWGHFAKIDENKFYKKMFEVFSVLLKEQGRAVVLCAETRAFLSAFEDNFTLLNSMPILLSGKKTVIYQFIKKEF